MFFSRPLMDRHTSLMLGRALKPSFEIFPTPKNLVEENLKFYQPPSIGSAYFVVTWASQPELNK